MQDHQDLPENNQFNIIPPIDLVKVEEAKTVELPQETPTEKLPQEKPVEA